MKNHAALSVLALLVILATLALTAQARSAKQPLIKHPTWLARVRPPTAMSDFGLKKRRPGLAWRDEPRRDRHLVAAAMSDFGLKKLPGLSNRDDDAMSDFGNYKIPPLASLSPLLSLPVSYGPTRATATATAMADFGVRKMPGLSARPNPRRHSNHLATAAAMSDLGLKKPPRLSFKGNARRHLAATAMSDSGFGVKKPIPLAILAPGKTRVPPKKPYLVVADEE